MPRPTCAPSRNKVKQEMAARIKVKQEKATGVATTDPYGGVLNLHMEL